MILFWNIRYLDTKDGAFKDRQLWLDTDDLDAVTKAAVETCNELRRSSSDRVMLKYRHLFKPENAPNEMHDRVQQSGHMDCFSIHDYHEDENANVLTIKQLAKALTGNENALLLPAGTKKHDLAYMFADKPSIDVGKISLSQGQLSILGYFARDLKEMRLTAFFKEGPGKLTGVTISPPQQKQLLTAVSDEEIRSFVTIFRRLYMKKEPANLEKAAEVFKDALAGHPAATWIEASVMDIMILLDNPPHFVPFVAPTKLNFTLKLLVDVFLYTQYAHQPDQRRSCEFQQCLQDVGNDRAVLTYLFLSELWQLAIQISNVGQHISELYDVYFQHHKPACDVVSSVRDAHPGIGALEKAHQREDRILHEKAEELANAMWQEAGEPPGGSHQFVATALTRLRNAMNA